jgi:hypothetical protein
MGCLYSDELLQAEVSLNEMCLAAAQYPLGAPRDAADPCSSTTQAAVTVPPAPEVI